jgi:hypothetical protein
MAVLTTITGCSHRGNKSDRSHIPGTRMFIRASLIALIVALFGCGGAATTTDTTPTPPTSTGNSTTGSASLAWSAPTTNVDGTPLTDLAGFKVYYGTTPGVYASIVVGAATSYNVVGLTKGQIYYFTVTAYDSSGYESDYAAMVSKLIS